jgi:hypothetical protein
MALTSVTTFDIVGQTQTITFNNPSQVDQITFSSSQITFATISSFDLVKSDMLLYFKYLNAFNNLLLINFPSISSSIGQIFPLCNFQLSETSSGVEHIIYNQTSSGNTVINVNYVPIATSAAFTARASPVTITLQEFFFLVVMMNSFNTQVNLN